MDQRLADHQGWIAELKASVDEEREFTLAADPHICAFGKWYDSYQSDSRLVNPILKKFDAPHKIIHGIAEQVTKLVHDGKLDAAHDLIDCTSQKELAVLVGLFAEIKTAMRETSRRRIAMVLENGDKTIALDVDEIVAVESLGNIEDAPRTDSKSIGISRIGRRKKDDELVLLMENAKF